MGNTRHTKTDKEKGLQEATSGASKKSRLVADTDQNVSKNSSVTTTATMQNASQKTWSNAELSALKSKIGLVAGALSDFQTAGGRVIVRNINKPGLPVCSKIYLVADGLDLSVVQGTDGLDFYLVAATPAESETK